MFREFAHEGRVIFEVKAEDYNYEQIIQAIDLRILIMAEIFKKQPFF
ncbi:hypothetical protein ACFQ3W_05670 [Paenibacillus puldeungensis]|uniref:Uncharacterized protein n=1 Tax=Paenibacillus puldeungensis TaxID=696536 RepID=A0ABW3RTK7_9BACL